MVEQVQPNPSVSGATQKFKEGAQEFKEAVGGAAAQSYQRAGEKFNEYRDVAKEKFAEYSDEATQLVREHPMSSVLVAFGAGLLFGMLMLRRND